jgi:hypothetical protein
MKLLATIIFACVALWAIPDLTARALFAQTGRGHEFMPCLCCLDVHLPDWGWPGTLVALAIVTLLLVVVVICGTVEDRGRMKKVAEEKERELRRQESIERDRAEAEEAKRLRIEQWTEQFGWWVGKRVSFTLDGRRSAGVVTNQIGDSLTVSYLADSGALGTATTPVSDVVEALI